MTENVDELRELLRSTLRDRDAAVAIGQSSKLRDLLVRFELELRKAEAHGIGDSTFTIKVGSEYVTLATIDIFFFEAQGRKAVIKTKAQEISFYANFSELTDRLPEWFIRTHKGFIVNQKRIKSVNFTDMLLILTDGSTVPISRTYRTALKEVMGL
jgi:DNA-binding LytR/AlgR family response regulator